MQKMTRALISLTDKQGIEPFASALSAHGIEILSTGGTAKKIRDAGVEVTEVAAFTGFPEILDGRVKTLHPKVHGGILHQRNNEKHQQQCLSHHIQTIDLIAVNLYAFEKTVADPSCSLEGAIENIDIGGPTMLRAAAKNFHDVTVVIEPDDYDLILDEIRIYGNTTLKTRFQMAVKVFNLTARYDRKIAEWLNQIDSDCHNYFRKE